MTRRSQVDFRADIEGLRGVAILFVILAHTGTPGFAGGYVGVDVFFVLSGYLITGILLREYERHGNLSISKFYARRIRRILPAASLVLVITVLASYHWLGFLQGNVIADDGRWTALFAANIHFALSGTQYLNATAPPSPLQHYWSLAVEEQFYLIWPLLIIVTSRLGSRSSLRRNLVPVIAALIAASYFWSIVETGQSGTWAYFSPLTRAGELGVGAFTALLTNRLDTLPTRAGAALAWAGLAGIVLSAISLSSNSPFPGAVVAAPVISTAVVIAGGVRQVADSIATTLGSWPMRWLGRISYSLYLWHWPILTIASEYANRPLSKLHIYALMLLAVLLAAITYRVIENPIRSSSWLRSHTGLTVFFGIVVILSSLTFCTLEISAH